MLAVLLIFCLVSTKLALSAANFVDVTNPQNAPAETEEFKLLAYMLKGYDKQLRPFHGGPPVQVNVSVFIRRINEVSESKMEFSVDMFFREEWIEPRLNYSRIQLDQEYIHLTDEITKLLWTPDIFFANEIASHSFSTTTVTSYTKLYPEGHLNRSTRYSITLSCPMALQYFPMDTQICPIEIESYGHSSSDLVLCWNTIKSGIGPVNLSLTNFQVTSYEVDERNVSITVNQYGRLNFRIHLSRALGFYLIQTYIPAALLVCVSWFSLWMGKNYIAERISLGVTTVLTITTLISSMNSTSPKIPYVKAIDVYMGLCFSAVFASLMQSVTIAWLSSQNDRGKGLQNGSQVFDKSEEHTKNAPTTSEGYFGPMHTIKLRKISKRGHQMITELKHKVMSNEWELVDYLDYGARATLPLTFIILNVIYWVYYLKIAH